MTYPVTLEVQSFDRIANWRPLVQWLLAIPQLVLGWLLLSTMALVVAVASWFAIVFTLKLPSGLAYVQAMILRYAVRT